MVIKQDPVTGLWCREDGAVLLPPSGTKFRKFRWTFGFKNRSGYLYAGHKGKQYRVHRLICRAFHGLPPGDKPETDHIDRNPANNIASNLRWSDRSMNTTNRGCVSEAFEKYGARQCEDRKTYKKAYNKAHREERKAYAAAYYAKKKGATE